jgi:UDP-N-acetylmuramate dehydrogenase
VHFPTLRGTLSRDVPLLRYTSWRCGGPADCVYVPCDRADLAAFVRQLPADEPLTIIGLGSNLLVRDGGIRGTVVVLHGALDALELVDGAIYAEAGVASPKVARFAAAHNLAGAEFLAGIPGTVGGALAMNAGCWGGETWRVVARVEVLTRGGEFAVRLPSAYAVGYRSVRRADGGSPDGIFTAAWFAFPEGSGSAARERIRDLLRRRIATQPLDLPNAGSVFRNPPGDHAARLIESCGLKGYAVGGARVSEKHANFIVNPEGRAKAADIEAIIAHVRATVLAATGVDLEPEVRVIGEADRAARRDALSVRRQTDE